MTVKSSDTPIYMCGCHYSLYYITVIPPQEAKK